MKLLVCAGDRLQEGWKTHDVQDLPGIDYCCDFWDLPKHIKNNSVSDMEFTHALEHFPMAKTQEVLKVLKDMLQEGGKLYIEVPNFFWHCEEILANPRNRQVVEYAYGGQLNDWDYHYNGFTPDILADDLEKAGFTVLSLRPFSSIECTVQK